MLLIRRFEERAIELQEEGLVLGTMHPYIGQEAIAVGVCAALEQRDRITSTHRGHGHCLAKGARPDRMFAELFGRVDGYCRGRAGSMHIADFSVGMLGANGIVGGGIPIATGAAFSAAHRKDGSVAVAFFGDGAAGAGVFHESLNIAALWGLPLILVCESNGWAVRTPTEDQIAAETIADWALPYGAEGVVVDGNDVEAVAEVAAEARFRAVQEGRPTVIEAVTYRMRQHAVRPGALPDSRDPAILADWAARDPIARQRERLARSGVLTPGLDDELQRSVESELASAVGFASASPFPEPDSVLENVYAS